MPPSLRIGGICTTVLSIERCRQEVLLDVQFSYEFQFVTGEIHFPEYRSSDVSSVHNRMTVGGEQVSSMKIFENHAMSIIGRSDRFGILDPRTVD